MFKEAFEIMSKYYLKTDRDIHLIDVTNELGLIKVLKAKLREEMT